VKLENFFLGKSFQKNRKIDSFFRFLSSSNHPRLSSISNMSSTDVVNTVPVANATNNVADAAPKEKKPNLPAKFAKFMQFGFFFVSSVKDAGLLDEAASRELFDRLCVFSSVDEQKTFYEGWLSSAKESNKVLRKTVAAWRKANLPPKPKVPRVKKDVDPNAPKKERKPRAKKTGSNDLINELASLTVSDTPPPPPPADLTTEVAVKKPRKPRAKKDADVIPPPDIKKSSKKTIPKVPLPEPVPDNDDDLDVREFVFDGKTFLLDDHSGNIFDLDSHEHLGHFDSNLNRLILL
jgi:hypothetical protein